MLPMTASNIVLLELFGGYPICLDLMLVNWIYWLQTDLVKSNFELFIVVDY